MMGGTGVVVLYATLLCTFASVIHAQEDCQLRLIRDLLGPDVYDTSMRPLSDGNETVNVSMTASLFQIMELDEQKQELNLNLWVSFAWIDFHFVWDPRDYCGVEMLTVASYRVWKPDVVLINSISEVNSGIDIFAKTDMQVYSDGLMRWPTLAIVRASCRVDIRDFPFDRQNCPLVFSSWTEDTTKLILTPSSDSALLDSYVESGEWTLIGMPAEQSLEDDDTDGSQYAMIVYTLEIKRKPLFFMFNLVLPCILMMAMGILTFCLAPDTGEKIPLCTTLLLTMMFFQIMVSDSMPSTSDAIPLLSRFCAVAVILLALATAFAVTVMALFDNAQRGREVPDWLRHLTWRMSWLVCLRSRAEEILPRGEEPDLINDKRCDKTTTQNDPTTDVLFNVQWNTLKGNVPDVAKTTTRGAISAEDCSTMAVEDDIQRVSTLYMSRAERKQNLWRIARDWHIVINVIDRFLLYLFALVTVGFSVVIMLLAGL